jgi:hypothetical protein
MPQFSKIDLYHSIIEIGTHNATDVIRDFNVGLNEQKINPKYGGVFEVYSH